MIYEHPTYISTDGVQYWYANGFLHREDGPAVIYPDGHKKWYKNGRLHCEDGPAVIHPNGRKEWYKNGKPYEKFCLINIIKTTIKDGL